MAQQFTYKRNQKVRGGTLQRTNQRLKQTGHVKGVNTSDGITGREARLVKRASNRPRPGHTHDGVPRQHKPRLSADERSLRQEVRADTRLAYGPQERELDYRRQQEQQFSSNDQSYYAKHVQDMQQAQRDQQVFQQGLLAGQNAAVQQAATTDQNANNTLLQQQQADAAQRGATVDPSVAQTLQQGVAARQASGVAGTTQLAQQASAQGAYMANNVQVAGEQGIQAQQDSQARLRKYDELAAQLAADKGAYRVKTRADIQNQRHKSALENAAFGVDTQNTLADNARADRTERRQARGQRQLNRDRGIDNRRQAAKDKRDARKDTYQRQHGLGPYKPTAPKGRDVNGDGKPDKYTQSQRNGAQRDYRKARSVSSGIKGKPGQIISFLVNKKGIDPLVARAAVAPGTLTAGQRAELRRMGVHFKAGHPGSAVPRNPDGTPG